MDRFASLDYLSIEKSLSAGGFVTVGKALTNDECAFLMDLFSKNEVFRSTVDMVRHNYDVGAYRYFKYPLPELVQSLRTILYRHLVPLANRWMEKLKINTRFPAELDMFLPACHQNHQTKPTPLVFRYDAGGYNNLHRDAYGKIFFPFQAVFVLNQRDHDFEGGDFVIAEVDGKTVIVERFVAATQGDMVMFASMLRPASSTTRVRKIYLRHGVRPITSGTRFTFGIIFQDAK